MRTREARTSDASLQNDDPTTRLTRSSRRNRTTEKGVEVPALKKIKQELTESEDDDLEARQRCVSDLYTDSDLFHSDSNTELFENEPEQREEEWQAELHALVREGEATLDDYSADCDTTLKWVVKHGIRLAITCTKCNIMEHVDGSQLMQDHGLSCENKYAGDEDATADEDEEAEINIFDLPRPLYSEKLQLSLRKSLERNSSMLRDLPDELAKLPLKYIFGRNGKKRAGMCTHCGEIFLSTHYIKWKHECWLQDNEVNGFLVDEHEIENMMNTPIDEMTNKDPELLQIILNKPVSGDESKEDGAEESLSEQRLSTGVRLYDREWAYSIRSRLARGELKTKPMIANSDYCIQYLINSKGIILANLCINCSRVFSPSISASNRSRHISVCYLSKRKRTIKKEPKSDADQSLANLLDRGRTYLNYSKNARSRKAYQLKKMDRNTDYNINLEALMSKALSSDLLPPEVFYANGMKAVFNKLLKIGFDLGQQPGTVLPNYDEFLPSRATTEANLSKFIKMDKFRDVFGLVSGAFEANGGTIAVESIGNRNPAMSSQKFVVLSFLVLDEGVPKRFIADLLPHESPQTTQTSIEALLLENNINFNSCNLFTSKQANDLLKWDKVAIKSSCFGDFLNRLAEEVFEEGSVEGLSDEVKQGVLEVKMVLDKTPSCLKFLQSNCSFSTDVRALLRCEFDSRWFVQAAWARKLLLLLKNHSESIIGSVLKVEDGIVGKNQTIEFIEKATGQLPNLQQYVNFVQILINCLEPCSVLRRPTAHLVVLKFQLVREQLKAAVDREPIRETTRLYRELCSTALDSIDLLEDGEFPTKGHFLATLLAPGHREQLKKWYDENRVLDFENDLIHAVRSFSNSQQFTAIDSKPTEPDNSRPSEQPITQPPAEKSTSEPDDIELELERYFEAKASNLVDPLEWWSENEELAPRVARFARKLFTMPAVSTTNDKMLPGHLSSMHLSEFLRRRVLFNWAGNSELHARRARKEH